MKKILMSVLVASLAVSAMAQEKFEQGKPNDDNYRYLDEYKGLKEYIDNEKVLTWKDSVHFIIQVLRALQHAHDRGIVHRDIKPQNIIISREGKIKVADFGIARIADSATLTRGDMVMGSVHYFSPEQARGEGASPVSDIYYFATAVPN